MKMITLITYPSEDEAIELADALNEGVAVQAAEGVKGGWRYEAMAAPVPGLFMVMVYDENGEALGALS